MCVNIFITSRTRAHTHTLHAWLIHHARATQAEGGAASLSSWIDALPYGGSVLLASCSRLAWAYDLDRVGYALGNLSAADPPSRRDDAYALVGVKIGADGVASAPLAEARTACCASPPCHECDQTAPVAAATVACAANVTAAASVLDAAAYLGGEIGSPSYVQARGHHAA